LSVSDFGMSVYLKLSTVPEFHAVNLRPVLTAPLSTQDTNTRSGAAEPVAAESSVPINLKD